MAEGQVKVNAFKKVGRSLAGTGPIGFGMDFVSNVAAGDNLGTSAMKAGVTGVLAAANPLLFGVAMATPLVKDVGISAYKFQREKQQWWNKQFAYDNLVGGNYVDTQRAMTMRQAAVQSIQASKLNARSALGSEARILNPYDSRRY